MQESQIRQAGKRAVDFIEDIGLVIIIIATVIAAGKEIWHMIEIQDVMLADLLLMFIYLEVVAMVHAYWQSGHMPVRMPLYIAMVALARYLILDMKSLDEQRMIMIAVAILVIGLAVLVIRFGHVRFPYETRLGANAPAVQDKPTDK